MPLKNILQSGICYTVIIITASLTSCQAKQAKELIFTIFLLGKFLLSPHSINFQFYLSMSVLFFLLNSSLHSLLQWFSYDFFVQDTWTLALPHYSQRIPLPRVSLAELKPSDRTLSPSCLHLLFSCSSGRIYSTSQEKIAPRVSWNSSTSLHMTSFLHGIVQFLISHHFIYN